MWIPLQWKIASLRSKWIYKWSSIWPKCIRLPNSNITSGNHQKTMKIHVLKYHIWLAYITIFIPTSEKICKKHHQALAHNRYCKHDGCNRLTGSCALGVGKQKGHSLSVHSGSSGWITGLQHSLREDSATSMDSPAGGRHLLEKKVAIPLFLEKLFSVERQESTSAPGYRLKVKNR